MRPVASTMTEIDHMEVDREDEVAFSISPANSAWVMRSMADLYSNRELAVIREYSTNAYDSNKELALANGTEVAPIHVTLPSAMNPYFTVQDYGVGMSERELKEVYTQFGESTKRESDDFNGMLGFGSKSGIAYTNTFTVTSVKDGRKTVGVVTRREDSMGGYLVTLKIILKVESRESSGVKIEIPVHNWREFERKALDFYRFWTPGKVLVNGREIQWAVGEKIDDNLYYYPHAGISYVVMGNVPYRIENPDALFPRGMNKISFVAYVENGAVEFTPSREDLKYSEHTKRNLHKIINDFIGKSVQTAKNEIAAATTHAEAYKVWTKWRNVIGASQVDDLSFKGDKLVEEFEVHGMRYATGGYRNSTYKIKEWTVQHSNSALFVTDFAPTLAASHKKKAKDWMGVKGLSASYIIFCEGKVKSPWVDPSRIVTWEQIKREAPKAPKKPRAASVNWGRKAGSFDIITRNGRKNEQDVPSDKPLYFVMVQEYNRSRDLGSILAEFDMDDKVVLVPANRKEKFLRFYPHAQPIRPVLEAKVELDGMKLLDGDAKTYLQLSTYDSNKLAKMDESRVDDPVIKVLIRICKRSESDLLRPYTRNRALANMLGLGHKFKPHPWEHSWNRKNTPLVDSYPLSTDFSGYVRNDNEKKIDEHVYFYMNEMWKARKAGKKIG